MGLHTIHTHASSSGVSLSVLLGTIAAILSNTNAVAVAAALASYIAGFTKFFEASRPFWTYFPAWVDRWAPTVLMIAGSLPAKLSGVQTWGEFGLVIMGAVALGLPGRNPNPPAPQSFDVEVKP